MGTEIVDENLAVDLGRLCESAALPEKLGLFGFAFDEQIDLAANPVLFAACADLLLKLHQLAAAGLNGAVGFNLRWTVFDGGARKNRVARAQADVRAAEAQVNASRDEITNQVWAAYSNLNTAFRQRESAIALLQAATQSYQAALESYNYGLRNLLDVTSAQQTLAQARSSDVLARTQVLASFADLAFRIGDSIQPPPPKP